MKALTWHGIQDVRVTSVPDPRIEEPTDAIIRVTSTAICGSDLHLYGVLAPFLTPGDVLGHEFMGVVEAVGANVTHIKVGDRVVIPFNISCGRCWMCQRGLFAQCEITQVREKGKGGALFGYTSLYGQVPGGQAEYVRVPHADFGPIVVPHEGPDEHFLFLSDILPTAWQAARFADVTHGDTVAVLGLGPVGQLAVTSAFRQGAARVIGVDLVPDRIARAQKMGAEVIDIADCDDVAQAIVDMTDGRGADGVIDAVGMEAHGNPLSERIIAGAARLPKPLGQKMIETMGIDRLNALHTAIDAVRRGGTVSISGVYGGVADPMPLLTMFDKGITMRMGQCHVKRWTEELLETLLGGDPFGVDTLKTHTLSLDEAPQAYQLFQTKQDGCLKVVLKPGS